MFKRFFEIINECCRSIKMISLKIFIKLWIIFKKPLILNSDWMYIYSKTPMGSMREKAAFEKVYNECLTKEAKNLYSCQNLPNVFRKLAFGVVGCSIHNSVATKLRHGSFEKIEMWTNKLDLWSNFLFTNPDSIEENSALKALIENKEISENMLIDNQIVRITLNKNTFI